MKNLSPNSKFRKLRAEKPLEGVQLYIKGTGDKKWKPITGIKSIKIEKG
jgi:hypothetical protein